MLGGAGARTGPSGRRPPATVVIVAAGSGERLGADRPKALVPVAGRPMYEWSLRAARRAATVGAVVIATPPGREGEFERPGEAPPDVRLGGKAVSLRVVPGGAVRSESVLRALAAVETELVAVHDAARPLVASELFDLTLERLARDDSLAGVIAAAPVTDTIKRAAAPAGGCGDLPLVGETLDRGELWAVQTPQAFRSEALREALRRAGDLAGATDDAMLVEALGLPVALLPAPADNFKITTPEDLARAEYLMGPETER